MLEDGVVFSLSPPVAFVPFACGNKGPGYTKSFDTVTPSCLQFQNENSELPRWALISEVNITPMKNNFPILRAGVMCVNGLSRSEQYCTVICCTELRSTMQCYHLGVPHCIAPFVCGYRRVPDYYFEKRLLFPLAFSVILDRQGGLAFIFRLKELGDSCPYLQTGSITLNPSTVGTNHRPFE